MNGDDAGALARLMTADDLDYPVEDARRVLARYKPSFPVRGGRFELMAVNESRNTFTYRVTWEGETQSKTETIVLRYGDGLLGYVEPGME